MQKNDIEKLKKILNDFYLLTGFFVSVFDKKGTLICACEQNGVPSCGEVVIKNSSPVELFGKALGFISISARADDEKCAREKSDAAMRFLCAYIGYKQDVISPAASSLTLKSKIENYIESNLDADLSVRSLSEHFSFTHREIYAFFKDNFGTTPAEYIKDFRLAFAAKLLRESKLAVFKVAKRVGIDDYNYFSKLFRAHFNVCPRNYRKSSIT